MNINAPFIILLILWALSDSVLSEEIFCQTDSEGRVHYSTKPFEQNDKPVTLPEVKRENLDERIKEITNRTPPTCTDHGGDDCSNGPDEDGSVVCLDGYKDSILPYRFRCMQVRLSTRIHALTRGQNSREIELTKASEIAKFIDQAQTLRLSLRNRSNVKAYGISVKLSSPGRKPLAILGPKTMEPYGIADYSLAVERLRIHVQNYNLDKIKFQVDCSNCAGVSGK